MATPKQHAEEFKRRQKVLSIDFMNSFMDHVRNIVVRKLTGEVLFRQTGRLVKSITTKTMYKLGIISGVIGTNVWYGVMWETEGFSAHTIVPTKAKALRIPIGQRVSFAGGRVKAIGGKRGQIVIYRKKAFIPKQAARPFLRPSLTEAHPFFLTLHKQYFPGLIPKEPIVIQIKPPVK